MKTNRMGITKWSYHKERRFASGYFVFWKFCFSIRASYIELICTNYPNVHIHTFLSTGNLFEGAFSLWLSLKLILLLQLETVSVGVWRVLCEQFCCSCMFNKTRRNRLQLFKETTWVVGNLLCCWSSSNFNDMRTYLL